MSNPSLLLAPFSQEAEEAVIGSILTSPDLFRELGLWLTPADFYLTRHAVLWETFARLYKDGLPIDLTTLHEDLKQRGKLDDIGGPAYLIHLIGNTPNSMHADAYGMLVQRAATRRHLLIAADKIRDAAMNEGLSIHDVLHEAETAVLNASGRHIERRGEWIEQPVERIWQTLKRLYEGGTLDTALKTGYETIDGLLNGLEDERFYVLAARPGMGKTALMLNVALKMARAGIPVAVFTMEMSTDQLVHRLLAIMSGISTTRQKKRGGIATKEDADVFRKAKEELEKLPIHITDDPSPSPRTILTVAQGLVKRDGVQAIFVDGLYRMSPDHDTRGDETAAYSQIARGLKTIARTLRKPIFSTHQLNRELEKRTDKKPILSDLRQSGRIEEEADTVLFLYRPVVYDTTQDPTKALLIVAKNRDGDVGVAPLYFEAAVTRFSDAQGGR